MFQTSFKKESAIGSQQSKGKSEVKEFLQSKWQGETSAALWEKELCI